MRNSSKCAQAVSIFHSFELLGALADRVARRACLAVAMCACAIASVVPLPGTAEARDFERRSERTNERGALNPLATMRISQLPPQGRDVLAAIHAGGPFTSHRDGIVFGNRERILPQRPRGFYAEYTVPTPGERTRGARRIIAGRGNSGDFRNSGEYYYTDDHYQSFRRIVQ